MQACGLKQYKNDFFGESNKVTPHAGVWIETLATNSGHPIRYVTPHAGVWIETYLRTLLNKE